MKNVYRVLASLNIFVGVCAIFGGMAAILFPEEPLGVTVDILENSPFENFLIPGIILFAVIGIGNILSAFLLLRFNLRYQGYISSIFSWALIIWIIVQCIMLDFIIPLHILLFIIGLVEAALSIVILKKQVGKRS